MHLGALVLVALVGYAAAVALIYQSGNRDLLLVLLTLGLLAPMLLLVLERNRQVRQIAAMKAAALGAELSALKSQINPHFFSIRSTRCTAWPNKAMCVRPR